MLALIPNAVLAQGGAGGTGSGSNPGYNDEYIITGPVDDIKPGPGVAYVYERQMPEETEGVYWYVVGALTINGAPASSFHEGDLRAQEMPSIEIEWDSVPRGNLQLRRMQPNAENPDVHEPVVLASFWFDIRCPSCSLVVSLLDLCEPSIQYIGLVGSAQAPLKVSDNYVCSDVNISGPEKRNVYQAPYVCFGLRGGPGAAINWQVEYITEHGNIYEERWSMPSASSLFTPSKYIYVTWFSRVPTYRHQTIMTNGMIPVPALPPGGPSPNALAGERIVGARLSYLGFECGSAANLFGWHAWEGFCGAQFKSVNIFYEPPKPTGLFAWTGTPGNSARVYSPQPLPCANGTVNLECDPVPGATSYTWTTDVGNIASTTTTNRTTLDLSQVPATAATVTVTVRANNANAPCTQQGQPLSVAFPIPQTAPPVPVLTTVSPPCPNTTRTLSTLNLPDATYTWTTTSGLFGPNNTITTTTNQTNITFPNANGPVTVSVYIQQPCKRRSVTGSTTFDVGANVASIDTSVGVNQLSPICTSNGGGGALDLALDHPQAGVVYTYAIGSITCNGVVIRSNPHLAHILSHPGLGDGTPFVQVAVGTCTNQTGAEVNIDSFNLIITGTSGCGNSAHSDTWTVEVEPQFDIYCRPASGNGGSTTPGTSAARTATLSPNPTTDQLTITLTAPTGQLLWVKVRNAQGSLVRVFSTPTTGKTSSIDLSGLPNGIYGVQLYDGQELITRRVAKQ